jgi:hypothetical protein
VHVDEPGCDSEAIQIDHLCRLRRRQRADRFDTPVRQHHIAAPARCAGSVDDGAAAQQQISLHLVRHLWDYV